MTPSFIIRKKRDGGTLTAEEIGSFIHGYTEGHIPDYQMSALAMAIYFRGMDDDETTALTRAMLESGATLQWTDGEGPFSAAKRVDKHSTGGVGDKVSLILAPLLACCGLAVPMISGRGLGSTGGTLDKLESIPGFRTHLHVGEIQTLVHRIGCAMAGQTDDLVPADKKLYALRDVTATVPSIPLITASIISKKLAENLDALVLDIKWGSGAFMKVRAQAHILAQSLVRVGRLMGLRTTAIITDMNQPLGRMAGNAVEVHESLAALAGQGPADLKQIVLELGSELLVLAGRAANRREAVTLLEQELRSDRPLKKFREMVFAQGGDPDAELPRAPETLVLARRTGYVTEMDVEKLGDAVVTLGGGRRHVSDAIDPSVGFEMLVRLGDAVANKQPLVRLFAHDRGRAEAMRFVAEAITIDDHPPAELPLIVERITPEQMP
jgi:pyrimidine-nucleoside phosphorylase